MCFYSYYIYLSDIAPRLLSICTSTKHLNIPTAIAPSIFDLNIPSSIHPASTYAFITLCFFSSARPHLILYLALFVKIVHPIIHHIN